MIKHTKTLKENLMTNIKMGISRILNIRIAKAEEVPVGEGASTNQPGEESQAGEQQQTPTTPTTNPEINFESLIQKARQEEKDKLYPEITKLKTELDTKVKRINELLIAIGEKDELVKQANEKITNLEKGTKNSESEQVKSLNLRIEELESTIALKETEIANVKIEGYKASKVAEANGELIPELVTGNTEEEINASIELAKLRYSEIKGAVQSQVKATTLNSNNIPPANPNTQYMDNQTSNLNTLDSIDMFSKEGRAEFAKMRNQLGLK